MDVEVNGTNMDGSEEIPIRLRHGKLGYVLCVGESEGVLILPEGLTMLFRHFVDDLVLRLSRQRKGGG